MTGRLVGCTCLALLLGCGGGGNGAASSSVAPDDGAECAADVRDLSSWLAGLDEAHAPVSLPPELELVPMGAAPRLALPGRLVVVGERSVSLDGRVVTSAGEPGSPARDRMMSELKRLGEVIGTERTAAAPPSLTPTLLAVDASARWWLVRASFEELRNAGVSELTLLFGRGSWEAPALPPSTVDAALRGKTDLASIAPTVTKIYAGCPAATPLFTALAESRGSARAHAAMVKGLPEVVAACHCSVEMAAVKAAHLAIFSTELRPVSGVAVRFPPTAADLAELDPVLLAPASDDLAWGEVCKPILEKATADKAVTLAIVREDARPKALPLPKKKTSP